MSVHVQYVSKQTVDAVKTATPSRVFVVKTAESQTVESVVYVVSSHIKSVTAVTPVKPLVTTALTLQNTEELQ